MYLTISLLVLLVIARIKFCKKTNTHSTRLSNFTERKDYSREFYDLSQRIRKLKSYSQLE